MSFISISVEGNIATDPELRYLPGNGTPVCGFRVMSTARMRNDKGEWVDGDTTTFEVRVWNKAAEAAVNQLRKGQRVIVTGSRIAVDVWKHRESGDPRAALKLTADRIAVVATIDQRSKTDQVDREREPVTV